MPIQVVARVRPLSSGYENEEAAVVCTDAGLQVAASVAERSGASRGGLSTSRVDARSYSFNASAGPETTQAAFSDNVVGMQELVAAALDGYAVTIFAFGQTGAGKTHTLAGPPNSLKAYNGANTTTANGSTTTTGDDFALSDDAGLVPRALSSAFASIKADAESRRVDARMSICEIYSEQVTDLLEEHDPSVLTVRHSPRRGFYVDGLSQHACQTSAEALGIFGKGFVSRRLGSHRLNAASNRSHCIMTLHLDSTGSEGTTRHGKMVFVDLAGSERLKQSGSSGAAAKETGFINRSLFVLGKVISSLGAKSGRGLNFVPYRESKLTQLLIDGLHGRGRSVMIACCAPEAAYADDTMNTLHFARLASNITAEPVVILDPHEQMIQELRGTISSLKQENLRLVHKLDTLMQGKAHGLEETGASSIHDIRVSDGSDASVNRAPSIATKPVGASLRPDYGTAFAASSGRASSNGSGGSIAHRTSNGSSDSHDAASSTSTSSLLLAATAAATATATTGSEAPVTDVITNPNVSSEEILFPELAALEAEFQRNLAIARGEIDDDPGTENDTSASVSDVSSTVTEERLHSTRDNVNAIEMAEDAVDTKPAVQPDPLATRWAERNRWFGSDTDMTQAAYDAHDELIAKGVDSSSTKYYNELSKMVMQRFPDKAHLVWDGSRSSKPSRRDEQRLSSELRAMNPKYSRHLPRWTPTSASSTSSSSSSLYKSFDGSLLSFAARGGGSGRNSSSDDGNMSPTKITSGIDYTGGGRSNARVGPYANVRYGSDRTATFSSMNSPTRLNDASVSSSSSTWGTTGPHMSSTLPTSLGEASASSSLLSSSFNGKAKSRSSSALSTSSRYSYGTSSVNGRRQAASNATHDRGGVVPPPNRPWDSSTSAGAPGLVMNNSRQRNSFDVHRKKNYELVPNDELLPVMVLDRDSFIDRRERIMAELQDARRAAEDEHRRILDKLTTSFTTSVF